MTQKPSFRSLVSGKKKYLLMLLNKSVARLPR